MTHLDRLCYFLPELHFKHVMAVVVVVVGMMVMAVMVVVVVGFQSMRNTKVNNQLENWLFSPIQPTRGLYFLQQQRSRPYRKAVEPV